MYAYESNGGGNDRAVNKAVALADLSGPVTETLGARVPAVALTAYASETERNKHLPLTLSNTSLNQ